MLKMEVDKAEGKMELIEISGNLMPKGKPEFLQVVKYPKIEVLVQDIGKSKMMKVLFLMLKDFCGSMNVVRNMNEDQMIEGAAMLLHECGNFRLEDYVMMFSMAKRGELVKIYDRIDVQVLTDIMDNYWQRRNLTAESEISGEINHLETLGNTAKQIEDIHPIEAKMLKTIEGLAAGFTSFRDLKPTISEETAKSQIVANPNYKNPYPKPE
jgi:hypothetical protein